MSQDETNSSVVDSSSEDDEDETVDKSPTRPGNDIAKSTQAPSTISPATIVTPETPSFQNVAITNSENVHFGHNTYINGPVTIIRTGIDNENYVHTDGDTHSSENVKNENLVNGSNESKKKKYWIIISIAAVSLLGIICSYILTMYITSMRSNTTPSNLDDLNSKPSDGLELLEVVYVYHNIVLTVFVVLLTSLLIVLTKFHGYLESTNHRSAENTQSRTDPHQIIAPGHVLRIVTRNEWLAQPVEKSLAVLEHPVPWVIITHTATENCTTQSECVFRVRIIQTFHIESRGWDDIGYNFLVGGDGSVYIGRGWDAVGAHTKGYNVRSIAIAFIGTFNNYAPPQQQVDACLKLIKSGVELGKIAKDYKLLAHSQLISTVSPGDKILQLMKEWPHFVSNFTEISELY